MKGQSITFLSPTTAKAVCPKRSTPPSTLSTRSRQAGVPASSPPKPPTFTAADFSDSSGEESDVQVQERFWFAKRGDGGLDWQRGVTLYVHNGLARKKDFAIIATVDIATKATGPEALGEFRAGYIICHHFKLTNWAKTHFARQNRDAMVRWFWYMASRTFHNTRASNMQGAGDKGLPDVFLGDIVRRLESPHENINTLADLQKVRVHFH
jgi:hypothetical protein